MPNDPWGDTSGTPTGYDPSNGIYNKGGFGAGGGGGFGGNSPVGATPWYQNPSTIEKIISAVTSLYGLGKGSGSTPNTYPVPLSPSEVTASNAKKSLFDYAAPFVDQYLRGLNNVNPSWSPSTSLLGPSGGGGFMGGVKVPTIDWSKMPAHPPNSSGVTDATGGQSVSNNPPKAVSTLDDIRRDFGEQGVTIANTILQQNPQIQISDIYAVLKNMLGTPSVGDGAGGSPGDHIGMGVGINGAHPPDMTIGKTLERPRK